MTQTDIQLAERRSIPLYTPSEGVKSLPVSVDRTIFTKTKEERNELKQQQNIFKGTQLYAWNERNRPGNNKKAA